MDASRSKRKRKKWFPVILLLAVLVLLGLGTVMVVRSMAGRSALPPETQEIAYVITEPPPPTTEPPTTVPPTEPTTAPPTTEPTTEEPAVKLTLSFYHAIMYLGDDPIRPVTYLEPADTENPYVFWSSTDETVAAVSSDGSITANGVGVCTIRATPGADPEHPCEVSVHVLPAESWSEPKPSSPSDWKHVDYNDPTRPDIQVIGGITYVQGVMIVNKTYPMAPMHEPGRLTDAAAAAFEEMCDAAWNEAGLYLCSHSDFRSYRNQAILYASYVVRDGKEAADTYSARPGYSEHETGCVIDVNDPSDSFNDTAEANWLEQNCARFGFVVRYPRGKDAQTGYKYESWHIRYIGREWAGFIHQSGLTLEEYFHITSAYPADMPETQVETDPPEEYDEEYEEDFDGEDYDEWDEEMDAPPMPDADWEDE